MLSLVSGLTEFYWRIKMKKIISVLSILVLGFGLTACGKKATDDTQATDATEAPAAEATEAPAADEPTAPAADEQTAPAADEQAAPASN